MLHNFNKSKKKFIKKLIMKDWLDDYYNNVKYHCFKQMFDSSYNLKIYVYQLKKIK